MAPDFSKELRQAGVPFGGYRELAQPIQDAQGASRWPLLQVTDQVLVAQRWRRNASAAPHANVAQLSARQTVEPAQEWFGASPAPRAAQR